MRQLALILTLMASGLCYAQYSNHQLYQAYLDRNMAIWEQYIVSTKWDSLSTEEQKQLLNYEYGFSAYMVGQNVDKARNFIDSYEHHLEDLKGHLSEARYYAYLSSVYTYKLALDKGRFMSYGKKLFDSIERAMKLDSKDALVLSMKGNVEFYSPFGNKKKALEYFQKADSLYAVSAIEYEQWNRRAVEMNIQQCIEKLSK